MSLHTNTKPDADYQDALCQIATVVQGFLMDNGGMRNGYCTAVSGDVCTNETSGSLTIYLPNIKDKTGNQVDVLVCELHNKIREVLEKHGLTHCRLSWEGAGHGCCNTSVEISFSKRVWLG